MDSRIAYTETKWREQYLTKTCKQSIDFNNQTFHQSSICIIMLQTCLPILKKACGLVSDLFALQMHLRGEEEIFFACTPF